MSHHLDSPTAKEDGRVDITDIYIFASENPGFTVLVMAVNPLAGELSPTTFRAGAIYDFKIDTNHDWIEDITYRLIFSEPDTQGTQHIEVQRLMDTAATEFDSRSTPITQGNTGEIIPITGGGQIWAGLAADPFFFNLEAYHQFRKQILEEQQYNPGVFDNPKNLLAGHNVTAIVLELPNTALETETIHLWGTTAIFHEDKWRTINRAANPLVQEVFIEDEHIKDAYNRTLPREDVIRYGETIATFVNQVTQLAGTAPKDYGQRVVQYLLPDVLTYTPQLPTNYGFVRRNGRTLTDDTPDVILSLLANTPLSDRVSSPGGLRSSFPYLAEPNQILATIG